MKYKRKSWIATFFLACSNLADTLEKMCVCVCVAICIFYYDEAPFRCKASQCTPFCIFLLVCMVGWLAVVMYARKHYLFPFQTSRLFHVDFLAGWCVVCNMCVNKYMCLKEIFYRRYEDDDVDHNDLFAHDHGESCIKFSTLSVQLSGLLNRLFVIISSKQASTTAYAHFFKENSIRIIGKMMNLIEYYYYLWYFCWIYDKNCKENMQLL